MKWFKVFTATAAVCVSLTSMAEVGPWELEAHDEDKDIKVFTRAVGDSPLREFKGVTNIKSDVNAFVALLKDDTAATNWMHDVVEFKLVDSPSDVESLVYTVNHTPWPVTNRDAYVRSIMTADTNGGVVSTITAEPDFAEMNEDYIRMPEIVGLWSFTPKAEGVVEVVYQVHANPGGSLPDWLVNAIVVETPMETLSNLQDIITEEKYQNQSFAFIESAMMKNVKTVAEAGVK
jgi:hypothetical protein